MDSSKKLYIGIAVLLALGGGVYLQGQQKEKEAKSYSLETKLAELPKLDVSEETQKAIDRIELTVPPDKESGGADAGAQAEPERLLLVKTGDETWELQSPVKYAANASSVKSLLDNLKALKVTEQISRSPDTYDRWGVTDSKALRAVFKRGDEVVADLYFGDNGSRGQMTRIAGHEGVYAVKGYSKFLYNRDAKGWRDKGVLKFDDKDVEKVSIRNENGVFLFTKTDDKWTAKYAKSGTPTQELERFKSSKVDDMIRAYKNLNASDFGDEKRPEDVGLDKPTATVEFQLRDGSEPRVVQLGNTGEASSNRWAQVNTSQTLFSISSWSADWATAEPSKFQEKKSEDEGQASN